MVQVLPENPSFGQQFARNLGGGLSQGLSVAAQMGLEKQKQQQRDKVLQSLLGGSGEGSFEDSSDPFARAKSAAVYDEQGLARIFSEEAKMKEKHNFAREQAAEPKLLELEDKLRNYETEGMRFERLQELFSPELENKFPSSITAALFTKDGELRPAAAASLSPEAQESVKLIADNLTGLKDSFGSRVTNFDIQSYMKRLPTLLNSSEGRRRVLRDLRMMNDLNQQHTQGVLDVVDRYGGPGKISISKAERIFKKEFAPRMKEIREEFVNPEKKAFSSLPSAKMYVGRTVVDEETGQQLRSDGNDWVPVQ